MTWLLKGTFFESCNCNMVCPCIFLSDPTTGECNALVGWHIDEGNDDGVDLSGLNVAFAVLSTGNMVTTPWKVAVYLDQNADEAQNGSLLKIFGGQAGGHPARLATHIGEIVGVKTLPMEFTINGGAHGLKIPDIIDVEIAQVSGQDDGPITVSGHPLCIAPGFTATMAKSVGFSYTDHDMSWNLTGKSAMFSPFTYASD